MKKILYFAAMATLFASSCQKEVDPSEQQSQDNNKAPFTITVSSESFGNPVKGTLNASNQLVWKTGDKIGVYTNEPSWEHKNQPFTLVGEGGSTTGSFVYDYNGGVYNSENVQAAFYPWQGEEMSDNNVFDPGTGPIMYYKLKSEYWGYSSGDMLTPLIASISNLDDKIVFRHAGAAVKLTINNLVSGTYKVKMAVDNQQITGDFEIPVAGAGTQAISVEAGKENLSKNAITLNSWKSNGAIDYIFPVPELVKPKLSFNIKDENGVEVWSKNLKAQPEDLARAEVLVMPAIDITPYSQFKTQSSTWTFCGTINKSVFTDVPMMVSEDGSVCILKGVTFVDGDKFKIRKDKAWDESYPAGDWVFNSGNAGVHDIIFHTDTHDVDVVSSKYPYPAVPVTLYFGINTAASSGVALSSSTLADGYDWPGLTLTQKEFINGKWYYKLVVDGGLVWGKTISGVHIVGIGSWNTNSSSLSFSTIKTEYYFEATSGEDITQLASRPSDPAHQSITIGTNLTDWASVTGATSGNNTLKIESDKNNIYIYCSRTNASGSYSEIWNGGGYVYLGFDLDNTASTGDAIVWSEHKFEFYALIYPYGGSSLSPAFYANAASSTKTWESKASGHVSNIALYGEESSGTATFELSIPRTDIPDCPASGPITVSLMGNKGMSTVTLTNNLVTKD